MSSLFNSTTDAMEAAEDLKKAGFRAGSVHVFTPESAEVSAKTLIDHGIWPSRAASTADAIHDGRSLVVVETPLGTAKQATVVLNRHRPNNSGISEVQYEGYIADETTYFSAIFRMPLLLKNEFPFSSWLGMPLLLKDNPDKIRSFGMPFLSKKEFPFSSALGLKLLSDNQSIFSGLFGFPQLSKNEFPLSSMLGLPLLLKSGPRQN
jgi:hypothetical protein